MKRFTLSASILFVFILTTSGKKHNFFLDKNRITSQIYICCIVLVTGTRLLFAYPENHVEIWLVILLLSRQKFHAKQMFVLSSSTKLVLRGIAIYSALPVVASGMYMCTVCNVYFWGHRRKDTAD